MPLKRNTLISSSMIWVSVENRKMFLISYDKNHEHTLETHSIIFLALSLHNYYEQFIYSYLVHSWVERGQGPIP